MEDPRCCGTGTCIINEDGLCWCGQRWNGERMCFPELASSQEEGGTLEGTPRSTLSRSSDDH
jgi:hypothetical protein